MSEPLVAVGSALWLGILTSISPCPLASNVAAVSFVSRTVAEPRRVLWAGLLYSAGRALTYVVVGMLVVSSMLSIPSVSFFLQERMNQILGPLLVFVGIAISGWIRLPFSMQNWADLGSRTTSRGRVPHAALLGVIFALSFCPVSAGLFFGALIPLAIQANSRVLLPAIYGIGTGLPVLIFAILLALGARWIGSAFRVMTSIEKAARPITGVVFIVAGLYLTATHLLGWQIL